MKATVSGPVPEAPAAAGTDVATFRYGAVFCLTLVTVAFLILAPATDMARAFAFALEGAALVVVVATSRSRPAVRRVRAAAGAVFGAVWVLAVALGLPPQWLVLAAGGVVSIAIPLALLGGLLRLVRHHGATLQAILGSLAIYLLLGLAFAWVIGFVARIDPSPYFANGTDGTESARVYFSFTALTTTGFGDLTAASPLGRALTVLEMLTGQLYLVTVIGVLIGSFARR
jgi:hypothetical protein